LRGQAGVVFRHPNEISTAGSQRALEFERRQAELTQKLQALHAELAAAPAADRDALAGWQLAGGRGSRPSPTVEPLEEEIAARQADNDALTLAVQRTMQEKASYVEKHRGRLVKDARKAVEEAHARTVALAEALEQARQVLVEQRQTELWCLLYPAEAVGEGVDWRDLAGGPLEPVKRTLGVSSRFRVNQLVAAVREDINWVRDAASAAQRSALSGRSGRDRAARCGPTSRRHRAGAPGAPCRVRSFKAGAQR